MFIDRDKIYELGDYKFKNFIHLTDDEIKSVWGWRNDEAIRKYMYNSDIIPFENHCKFVESLKERNDVAYWMVSSKDQNVGVINLASIDYNLENGEPGMYLAPEMMESGIGLSFAFHFFLFLFECIECKSLHGSVKDGNKSAYLLDSFLGCKFNGQTILDGESYSDFTMEYNDLKVDIEKKDDIIEFVNYIKSFRKNGIK